MIVAPSRRNHERKAAGPHSSPIHFHSSLRILSGVLWRFCCFRHLAPLSCHVYCSWLSHVARSVQYKALQLINLYLQQVYTNVQSSDMTHGSPVNRSTSFLLCPRSHPICFRPACHTYSVAPRHDGRGNAVPIGDATHKEEKGRSPICDSRAMFSMALRRCTWSYSPILPMSRVYA